MADDEIHQSAYDNDVFHNIVQHYDDTARGNHDDIDFDAASLDDLDGTEYDNNGNRVEPIDFDIVSGIILAVYEYDGFDNIPDDYEFDGFVTYEDDNASRQFIFILDFVRQRSTFSKHKYNPYRAPGDDDDEPGPQAA